MRLVPRRPAEPRPATEREILRLILQIAREEKHYYKSSLEMIREHISPVAIATFERRIRGFESQEWTFEIKFAMLTRKADFLKKLKKN